MTKRLAMQAEMRAELGRQRTKGERLAAQAAQCAAAGKAAVKEAERLAAQEAAPAHVGHRHRGACLAVAHWDVLER